jgi:hypothetical protein
MRNTDSALGGYFELEINNFGTMYHDDAVALNSGRNALEHILLTNKYHTIYVPYFTCDVLLEPIVKHGIKFVYYNISDDFKPKIISIPEGAALLYTNYFGLMNENIKDLSLSIPNLIIDNAQAFYDKPIGENPTFYSPRKFFGLPDGGFAYNTNDVSVEKYPLDVSNNRISHLITRVELGAEDGYNQFLDNDAALMNQPIKQMSKLTQKLMRGIDYNSVIERRLENFAWLHKQLRNYNDLTPMIDSASYTCPMVYPFLKKGNNMLRQILIDNRIYTAQYWPNVLSHKDKLGIEKEFVENIISLPIDQRYSIDKLNWVVKILKK